MTVTYEVRDAVAVVAFNRPEHANALDPETWELLADHWDRFESDDSARVAVLTGAPHRWFCGGLDVKAAGAEPGSRLWLPPGGQRDRLYNNRRTKPVIAAVNGAAVGAGAYMFLQSDLRVVAEDSFIALPEIEYGRPIGWELFLQEQMPAALAAELVSGFRISATRLFTAGLANQICPAADVVEAALTLARRLAERPARAVDGVLSLIRMCRQTNIDLHPAELTAGASLDADLAVSDEHRHLVALGPQRPRGGGEAA